MSEKTFVPFHRPSIGEEDIQAVTSVLQSKWLTTGPVALEFEHEFAAYVGAKHALAVTSGTAALQLGLEAVGLKPGDEVLVPSYTFTATGEVVTYFGARPVLCDSVEGGFNIDPADVRRKITTRTRAIVPVHIAGQACAMDHLRAIAAEHCLHIVEDAAHALPATYGDRKVGTISELTAFSFYATKTLTTGEGGMLTTDNDEFAQRASVMRLHGIGGDAWKRYTKAGSWYYEVQEAGYKMNLCDVLAALGRTQLRRCDEFWKARCTIRNYYDEAFQELEEVQLPPSDEGQQHAWHLYILRIRPELMAIERNEFISQLKEAGIGTSVHFIPLHLHPYYARTYGYRPEQFPNANNAYSRCISLPIFPDMSEAEIAAVIEAVTSVVYRNRKARMVSVTG